MSWLLALEPPFCAWSMGSWSPLMPGSLTDGISVLLGTLSLTTRSSSEDLGPWTDDDPDHLTLSTIYYLSLLKCVNRSLTVNHSSSNSGSSYWSDMTWILEFLDVTSLIQNYGYAAVLITTVYNMSSNTSWTVYKFITNPTCVECIFLNPILTPFWLLWDH